MSAAPINPEWSNRKIAAKCPNCHQNWMVAGKLAGHRAKCGKCENVMIVPHANRESFLRSPRKVTRPTSAEYLRGMKLARSGMLSIAWSIVLNCIFVFLVVLAILSGSREIAVLYTKYGWIANLAFLSVMAYGIVLGCRIPEETDSKKYSTSAAAFFFGSTTLVIASYYMLHSQIGSNGLLIAVQLLSFILAFAIWLLLTLYLKKVSQHLERSSLVTTCNTNIWGFSIAGGLLAIVILIAAMFGPNIIVSTFAIIAAVILLIDFGLMVYVLFSLAVVIRSEQRELNIAKADKP